MSVIFYLFIKTTYFNTFHLFSKAVVELWLSLATKVYFQRFKLDMEKNATLSPLYLIWCWGWTGVLVCSRIQRLLQTLKQSETLRLVSAAWGTSGWGHWFALHFLTELGQFLAELGWNIWKRGLRYLLHPGICSGWQVGRTLFLMSDFRW